MPSQCIMLVKNDPHKNLFIVIYLNSIWPLSQGLKSYLISNIKDATFAKGETICREGEKCSRLYVIKTGLVRGYFLGEDTDITTWISWDNEIFTSITGFFKNKEAKENIQALEDTHCVYLEYKDMSYCLKHFPEMRELNRVMMEEYYIQAENRALMARIPNALNRWNYFLSSIDPPSLVNRIPKKILASFLAMRPETLSRILTKYPKHLLLSNGLVPVPYRVPE